MPRGAPPPGGVPDFEPLRPARGARVRRALASRRRLVAALLAMAAAALAAAPRNDAEDPPPAAAPDGSDGEASGDVTGPAAEGRDGGGSGGGEVLAPVRIADAGVVGLLTPGDVVDVLAVDAEDGGPARVVARAARVAEIPGTAGAPDAEQGADAPGAAETAGATGSPESIEAPDASEEAPDEWDLPESPETEVPSGAAGLTGWEDGTLVVLSVPRSAAAVLAGAAAGERLVVTLR
ncbi:hypothetical protein OG946_13570 [Streptomyces sp. NBC_01808]|uniref:hypothetical protein n=1 Tax=Streptomyces sp. NBC_01808 TaxID=2975947 RepID=UPI002DDC2AD9|nr:hypothetical protein [Streptomyces sp. NBC_01808]WSA38309.1 hypothetical protein OG946_13570 [Streptomyces sp. NBC_01808]